MKNLADWILCYCLAWELIILSPLWLPIWLADKIKSNISEESGQEEKDD